MSRKMLINASEPEEIRVAIIEGSILEEYYVERLSVDSRLGNIYKGRVTNVEPSIGAAFVEFGGPRHGFLHLTDISDTPVLLGRRPAGGETAGKPAAAGGKPAADGGDGEASGEPGKIKKGRRGRRGGKKRQAASGAPDAEPLPGAARTASASPSAANADTSDTDDRQGDDDGDDHHAPASPASRAGFDGEDFEELDGEPGGSPARGAASHASAGASDDEDDDEDEPDTDDDLAAGDDEHDEDDADLDDEDEDDEDDFDDLSDDELSDDEMSDDRRPPRSSAPKIDGPAKPHDAGANGGKKKGRQITDLLKKGDEVIVQVTKDGIGTKGPTLTTYLSLPGRYLVLMPGLDRRGVSRKIEDARERDRLKKVLDTLDVRDELGFIVRTAGIGQNRRELQKDYRYLTKLWDRVEEAAANTKGPALLYRESDLVIRTIRDIYTGEMGDIIVDDEDVARRAREFLATVMPKAVKNVKLYAGERPLFTAYGIEDEIGKLFVHRVELKSGGSLVIEQTEALVAIDVNSGRFRDEEDLEETAYKINIEAADAIARQLRLRDLGGVLVLDFIDMLSEKRRRGLERHFREALKADRARIKVARMSPFGTIEMTRQRVRPSLRQSIFHRCPRCRGVGYVATHETLHLNLVRQIKLMLARRNAAIDVCLNQDNAEYFVNEKRATLVELEKLGNRPIRIHIETDLRSDEFRVVPIEFKGDRPNGH
jgi:ribonuclease E